MTRARVFGILADHEDQNDHDALRHDPIFKVVASGSLAKTLASQPTHSQFTVTTVSTSHESLCVRKTTW
jgi:hypothetical protein